MANTLIAQKKYEQALERILLASNLNVNLSNVWTLGLKLCHQLDRPDTAQLLIDQWRASGNDPAVLEHIQAAYFTQDVPDRASDGYVKTVFDSYAASFESSLAGLKYQGPALLAQYLQQSNLGSPGKLTILDAGCGTGLCGPVLQPYAKRLFGIDLSPGMLKIAKSKGVYHRLIEGELTAALGKFDNHFDLISSMDVLIYFGELQALLAACYRAMKTKAVLVFTTEANDQDSAFRLDKTGRYLHSSSYLKDTLTELGFTVELTNTILRSESGEDVKGYLVVATK